MSLIINTNIDNDIKDSYLVDSSKVRGGYIVTDDRTGLSSEVTITGTICYQNGQYYKYNNGWTEIAIEIPVIGDNRDKYLHIKSDGTLEWEAPTSVTEMTTTTVESIWNNNI